MFCTSAVGTVKGMSETSFIIRHYQHTIIIELYLRTLQHLSIAERFGENATIVITSQDYNPCITARRCYDIVLELYDIQSDTTSETIIGVYGAFTVDVFWISNDKALVVFESEDDANNALSVETTLFKVRKIIYGSDDAIISTINLAHPEGSNEFTLRKELFASTPKRRVDVAGRNLLAAFTELAKQAGKEGGGDADVKEDK
ncbi:hypothetical protein RI129_000184 [Pyrocoelia pectoralis]|uniref:Uncharacterized protein n=1 Tax=Pyrocoelia pectoralis TaxID=417401 RepID=A0AAN7V5I6_9COLE